jgi:predicted CXXCH cytochrome family protein
VAARHGGHRLTQFARASAYMMRMNDSLAAQIRTPGGSRRFAAISLVAAPVLMVAWLLMAAIPASADGGPHVKDVNSGVSTLTADSCAGCHRAHTAQGPMLLSAPDENALCLTCHGTTGIGATTDVMTGAQYRAPLTVDATNARSGPLLGALRSGGFDQARIDSANPARILQSVFAYRQWAKVGVGAAQNVTSAHLNLPENALSAPRAAWGNGALNSGAGPIVSLGCASCHNPHGNGQYRILNPVPKVTTGTISAVATPGVTVTDAALPPAGDARNYTVIQVKGPSYQLNASQVAYPATSGDYWHVRVPWNSPSAADDAPNGLPVTFNTQITAWCTACHSRYYSTAAYAPSGDDLYVYRHQTVANQACTTCHVAHGSNARMAGTFSAAQPFPDGTPKTYTIPTATDPVGLTGDSRLLKVDNRGTCQLCHDPTHTVGTGQYLGPLPTPGAP